MSAPKTTSSLLPAILICCFVEQVLASGTFNFVKWTADVSPDGSAVNPVLAVMELSGSAPYDHTSISSLTFTQEAGDVLGYVGLYVGNFDSSISQNRVIENLDHVLGSTATDPSNIGALFVDMDPPNFNAGPLQSHENDAVALQFFNLEDSFSYISNGTGHLYALGRWIRAIPEPSALALCAIGVLTFYHWRAFGCTTVPFPHSTSS